MNTTYVYIDFAAKVAPADNTILIGGLPKKVLFSVEAHSILDADLLFEEATKMNPVKKPSIQVFLQSAQ